MTKEKCQGSSAVKVKENLLELPNSDLKYSQHSNLKHNLSNVAKWTSLGRSKWSRWYLVQLSPSRHNSSPKNHLHNRYSYLSWQYQPEGLCLLRISWSFASWWWKNESRCGLGAWQRILDSDVTTQNVMLTRYHPVEEICYCYRFFACGWEIGPNGKCNKKYRHTLGLFHVIFLAKSGKDRSLKKANTGLLCHKRLKNV